MRHSLIVIFALLSFFYLQLAYTQTCTTVPTFYTTDIEEDVINNKGCETQRLYGTVSFSLNSQISRFSGYSTVIGASQGYNFTYWIDYKNSMIYQMIDTQPCTATKVKIPRPSNRLPIGTQFVNTAEIGSQVIEIYRIPAIQGFRDYAAILTLAQGDCYLVSSNTFPTSASVPYSVNENFFNFVPNVDIALLQIPTACTSQQVSQEEQQPTAQHIYPLRFRL